MGRASNRKKTRHAARAAEAHVNVNNGGAALNPMKDPVAEFHRVYSQTRDLLCRAAHRGRIGGLYVEFHLSPDTDKGVDSMLCGTEGAPLEGATVGDAVFIDWVPAVCTREAACHLHIKLAAMAKAYREVAEASGTAHLIDAVNPPGSLSFHLTDEAVSALETGSISVALKALGLSKGAVAAK